MIRTRIAASGAVAILALGACSTTGHPAAGSPSPTSSTTVPAPSSTTVDDPSRVADEFVATVFAWDTARDTRPQDAFARAADLLTPAYRSTSVGGQLPSGPGVDFLDLVAHHGRMVVEVTDPGSAVQVMADTPRYATRKRLVTQTPTGADGWQGAAVTYLVTVELVNSTGSWLVDSMTSQASNVAPSDIATQEAAG